MPIAFKCPSCGVVDSRPDYMAGQKTMCENCQRPGVVPGPKSAKPRLPDPVSADLPEVELPPEKPRKPAKQQQPGEPWYYDLPSGMARICSALASVAGLIAAAVAVFSAIAALFGKDTGIRDAAVVLAWSVGILLYLLPIWFSCAMVLLFVDMARNLRQIRQSLASMNKPGDPTP